MKTEKSFWAYFVESLYNNNNRLY